VSTGLLREQNMLRNFAEEHGSCFTVTGEKRFGLRAERDLCRDDHCRQAGLYFIKSTIFVFARDAVRFFSTATRGSLHVSHLIRGL
jgi:hypothetical protein